jgi:hypothetical protein
MDLFGQVEILYWGQVGRTARIPTRTSFMHMPAARALYTPADTPRGLYYGVNRPHCSECVIDSLHLAYDQHAFVFWLVLLVAVLVLSFWTWRVHRYARSVEARLDSVFRESGNENTARVLADYLNIVRSTAQSVSRMQEQTDGVVRIMPTVIRHVGLVRFSPFHDTGSDQSFALALLDGRQDGVVITALHSRTDSRLYAKPVERGKSSYSLTPEERDAMNRALVEEPTIPASRRA